MILDESFGIFFEVNKDLNDSDEEVPVFTFYPQKEEFAHYHMQLSTEKAEELYRWLGELLRK